MKNHTIHVELAYHRYPIYVGENLLSQHALFAPHIIGRQVMIVSNATVAAFYLSTLKAALKQYQCDWVELPAGEQYKDIAHWQYILDALLTKQHRRSTTLITLGGGVIGDIGGFAAACYLRGVNFIQVPTTLLAQVDASIGGKTGVNHPLGKNMIGTFHQPQCVVIDINTLTTLSAREYRAGIAEIIKYGLIGDYAFLQWLDTHMAALLARDVPVLTHAITYACRCKATIVSRDEREQHDRALLNLGHTFAHALEAASQYQHWLHGEAVAIGLLWATRLSHMLGYLSLADVEFVHRLLANAQFSLDIPKTLQPAQLLALMQQDKKATDAGLRFVILKRLGEAFVVNSVETTSVLESFPSFIQP